MKPRVDQARLGLTKLTCSTSNNLIGLDDQGRVVSLSLDNDKVVNRCVCVCVGGRGGEEILQPYTSHKPLQPHLSIEGRSFGLGAL